MPLSFVSLALSAISLATIPGLYVVSMSAPSTPQSLGVDMSPLFYFLRVGPFVFGIALLLSFAAVLLALAAGKDGRAAVLRTIALTISSLVTVGMGALALGLLWLQMPIGG